MRKRYLFVVGAVLVCLLLACLLCACGGTKNNNHSQKPTTPTDPNAADGWEKITSLIKQDMFSRFLTGFTSIAYEMSLDTLTEKKQLTADAEAVVTFNGSDFWVTAKGKYDRREKNEIRNKAILAVEISNEEVVTNDSRLISLFVFKDELYFAIGDNKAKFSIKDRKWTDYFPFDMEKLDAKAMSSVAGILANSVAFKESPLGYHRTNTKEEYKYILNLDVYKTLTNLLKELKNMPQIIDEEDIVEIKGFIASVLGVTVKQFDEGDVPESVFRLEFATFGSRLSELSCTISVGLAESAQKLFGTEKLDVTLAVNKVTLTNDYSNGVKIDFVNNVTEQSKYKLNPEATYVLSAPIRVYSGDTTSEAHYRLDLHTRVFQEDSTDNFLFLEYYDTESNRVEKAMYVYDNRAYVVTETTDEETGDKKIDCVYRFDVDLSDIANRVVQNNFGKETKFDLYNFIAYVLKSFSINKTEIDFRVSEELFSTIWFNFYDMIDFINDSLEDKGLTENEEVVDFIDYLTTNEVILCVKFFDSDLINIVQNDDRSITTILSKLQEYDEKFDAEQVEENADPEQNGKQSGEETQDEVPRDESQE